MVPQGSNFRKKLNKLSVLALSSRFDGPCHNHSTHSLSHSLSVLALSSRFDGPPVKTSSGQHGYIFQYSLCRVVLMVRACYSGIRMIS